MKRRWISLLTVLSLLAGLAVPVRAAAAPPDDVGGLCVPAREDRVRNPDTSKAPEDDKGGVSVPEQEERVRNPNTSPAPGDDEGGVSVPEQEERVRNPNTSPAPGDDVGGVSVLEREERMRNPDTSPAPEDDEGGVSVPEQEERIRNPNTSPAPGDDEGGVSIPEQEDRVRNPNTSPAPDDDRGGLAAASKTPSRTPRKTPWKTPAKTPAASGNTESDQESSGPVEGVVEAGVSLVTDRHVAYLGGSGGSFPEFHPWREVTRAELAVVLNRLLPAETPVSPVSFTDVAAGFWSYDAICAMSSLGVMGRGETAFRPDDPVTRGDFIRSLAAFFPLRTDAELFPDVSPDDPNAPYIISARAYGWTQGDKDGNFNPDKSIARYELVVMLNRALGRSADRDYILSKHPAFFVDVSPEYWFYYDIMEASVVHQFSAGDSEIWTSHTARTAPSEGFHLENGWLYYYDTAKGDVLRSGEIQGHTFNAAGRFTSGNSELDGKLRTIVLNKTNSSMSQEEMLRALFLYTRDSFTYLRRPAYAMGANDFMVTDALRMLNTGYGNCYCYAALFWFLSRWIGYDSVIYSGTVGQNRAPHSWVEIAFDGKYYIFDTELEMAYRRKGRYDVDLYKYLDTTNKWRYVRP